MLIQWHYVTANGGCVHEGYNEYPWPEGFGGQYTSVSCPPLVRVIVLSVLYMWSRLLIWLLLAPRSRLLEVEQSNSGRTMHILCFPFNL